jgi:cytochrome c oxidase cbb3-type subunit 3
MRMPLGMVALLAASALGFGCKHESRDLRPTEAVSKSGGGVVLSTLFAGGVPGAIAGTLQTNQENAYAMSEGKRLFSAYNCTGCHAHGGGGIGPALMDAKWIYGSAPQNVYATIVEGRPNGMPSFRGKIPDFQVAQLVAYVRSMSGIAGGVWAPGRDDNMQVKPGENTVTMQSPVRAQGAPPP